MSHNRSANLFEECRTIYQQIPEHFFSPDRLENTYLLAYLASLFNLKQYVELGVNHGKNFFPVAHAFAKNNGFSIGIDPFHPEDTLANERSNDAGKLENHAALETIDFESLYRDVLVFQNQQKYSAQMKIIRQSSAQAVGYFSANNLTIDMVFFNSHKDTKKINDDCINYLPLVSEGGFVILNDIHLDDIKRAYDELKINYLIVFETTSMAILWKQKKTTHYLTQTETLSKKLGTLYHRLIESQSLKSDEPKVTVGVLTYNHEQYIRQCLDSVYDQQGQYKIKIVICDDCSTDQTIPIIEDYIKTHHQKKNIEFVFEKNTENLGLFKNFRKLVLQLKGCDYLAFCEGDDYWLDSHRITHHINFLRNNPECALSANTLVLHYDEDNSFDIFKTGQSGELFETESLAEENFIRNLSASFYDGRYLEFIPESLFDMPTGDWFFNIFYSRFGDIGYIKKPLSVYRIHKQGSWSSLSSLDRSRSVIRYINHYNTYSNFNYNKSFMNLSNKCLHQVDSNYVESFDLVIIDDVFPHPLSGFRYEEFTSYAQYLSSVKILTTGSSICSIGDDSVDDLIVDYKRKHKNISINLTTFEQWYPLGCKLLYFVFLQNAPIVIPLAEQFHIPFVFTLYPGGGFCMDNPDSDRNLKKTLESPCFKKVIVTQKITFDYLIRKNFCTPDKIEFIFGVVTPLQGLQVNYAKQHFGFGKDKLDICFIAHKYTSHGQDKGYDTFVNVAKTLCEKYDNIYFHVVGNFDQEVIDVTSISKRIEFYGTQNQEWLDRFFIDKDIILSPNKSGFIFKGSFDGFPTASCTDAGLRKTAIFCTDELALNDGYFQDGVDIVIIPQQTSGIINKIEHFYHNPLLLKNMCEKGCQRIRYLYSYEQQLAPRIALLQEEILRPFIFQVQEEQQPQPQPQPQSKNRALLKKIIKRFCPWFLKKPGRKLLTLIRTF